MFIRSKITDGVRYFSVVRGVREGGKVRQVSVVSLGTCPTVEDAEAETLETLGRLRDQIENPRCEPPSVMARRRRRAEASVLRLEKHLEQLRRVRMEMGPCLFPTTDGPADTTAPDPYPWAGDFMYLRDDEMGWSAFLIVSRSGSSIRYRSHGIGVSRAVRGWLDEKTDPRLDERVTASEIREAAFIDDGEPDGSRMDEDGVRWIFDGDAVRAEFASFVEYEKEVEANRREWEEDHRLREEDRKRADWTESDQYVYRRSGIPGLHFWSAHRIVERGERAIVVTADCVPLAEVGTARDRLKAAVKSVVHDLRAVPTWAFPFEDYHEEGDGTRWYLNCEEVREAHRDAKEKDPSSWSSERRQRWYREFFGVDGATGPEPSDYDILGIKPGATAAEVKSAYRARAKETHPDRGGSAEAFRVVQEAYERLYQLVA